MIVVELSPEQVGDLLTRTPVELSGVTVRVTDGAGRVLNDTSTPAADVRDQRTDARQKLRGEPIFWMRAKFDSRCPHAFCATGTIEKGERVLRDTTADKTYCGPCGRDLHPNVVDPRAVRV